MILVVIPVAFLLLQALLATRKSIVVKLIIPILWTLLGGWIIIARIAKDKVFSAELLIFFLVGDFIFVGITILVRYIKGKNNK